MRIWFNRTFATNAHLVSMLRSNRDREPVSVFATHKDPDSPMAGVADHFSLEPDLTGEAYASWVVDYCAAHEIDVLIPQHERTTLAAARGRLASVGTLIVCGDPGPMLECEDKAAVYRRAEAVGVRTPPWQVVRTADEFDDAWTRMHAYGVPVCLKPTVGTGARGFHVIRHELGGLSQLLEDAPRATSRSQVRDALCDAERAGVNVPDLMVMPWMDAPETSVDLLTDPSGALVGMLSRTKRGRGRALVKDAEAEELAVEMTRAFGLTGLSNVQFRRWQDNLALLEVNARAGAGLFQGELAGVDLLWPAIRLARGLGAGPVRAVSDELRYTTVSSALAIPG